MRVWYRVRDLAAARAFYSDKLGFTETYVDEEGSWAKLERGDMRIALAVGEPEEAGVATIDVEDAKAEAERLRAANVEVGTVLELHNEVRLLDVFDPDGNRVQLVEQLRDD
ncbi:MAG TPA: VOC family protein [Gaiellaceae bacterium]|jgi:catechol 2,3-dioxygenase-like lactoylglutathione lyase family enzyme|nr:VOC family protein [Gaiellaceae bacterium]